MRQRAGKIVDAVRARQAESGDHLGVQRRLGEQRHERAHRGRMRRRERGERLDGIAGRFGARRGAGRPLQQLDRPRAAERAQPFNRRKPHGLARVADRLFKNGKAARIARAAGRGDEGRRDLRVIVGGERRAAHHGIGIARFRQRFDRGDAHRRGRVRQRGACQCVDRVLRGAGAQRARAVIAHPLVGIRHRAEERREVAVPTADGLRGRGAHGRVLVAERALENGGRARVVEERQVLDRRLAHGGMRIGRALDDGIGARAEAEIARDTHG